MNPDLKTRLSMFRAQALTMMGRPKGFFTPYDYVRSVSPVTEPYPEVEALFAGSNFQEFLAAMGSGIEAFQSFGAAALDPVWDSGMFPPLDGISAYAAVKMLKPQRIIEIGSGDSTRFLARAVLDNGTGRITCIDPSPRRRIEDLGVEAVRRVMTNGDADLCGALEPNDILFLDSSHIMLPGTDVDMQFNRAFPKLKSGVTVHVHDVFLPDGYPPHWDYMRFSEQNALAGWLLSGYFEVIYPGHYVATRHGADIDRVFDKFPIANRKAGSLWLRKA